MSTVGVGPIHPWGSWRNKAHYGIGLSDGDDVIHRLLEEQARPKAHFIPGHL